MKQEPLLTVAASDEMAVQALAGSLSIAMAYHVAARGYSIRKIRSNLVGHLNISGSTRMSRKLQAGGEQFQVQVELDVDLTDSQQKEIKQLGSAFSPLFDIISQAAPIEVCIVDRQAERQEAWALEAV